MRLYLAPMSCLRTEQMYYLLTWRLCSSETLERTCCELSKPDLELKCLTASLITALSFSLFLSSLPRVFSRNFESFLLALVSDWTSRVLTPCLVAVSLWLNLSVFTESMMQDISSLFSSHFLSFFRLTLLSISYSPVSLKSLFLTSFFRVKPLYKSWPFRSSSCILPSSSCLPGF